MSIVNKRHESRNDFQYSLRLSPVIYYMCTRHSGHITSFLLKSFGHSPTCSHGIKLGLGDGNHRTVTRVEVHSHGAINLLEVGKVGCFGKVITAVGVDIIHQTVYILYIV